MQILCCVHVADNGMSFSRSSPMASWFSLYNSLHFHGAWCSAIHQRRSISPIAHALNLCGSIWLAQGLCLRVIFSLFCDIFSCWGAALIVLCFFGIAILYHVRATKLVCAMSSTKRIGGTTDICCQCVYFLFSWCKASLAFDSRSITVCLVNLYNNIYYSLFGNDESQTRARNKRTD